MRRCKRDLVAARAEERTRCLAGAGRDSFRIAGGEIEHVDLIERIAGLALALKHDSLAVGRPVALTGAPPFNGQATNSGEEITLLIFGRRQGGLYGSQRVAHARGQGFRR